MEIVYKPLNEIRPYFRNARNNQRTIEVLCDIIEKVGFNVPIVIDKKGVIVKGHARYIAAIRLGMKEVPCIISEASDDNNNLDRLSDNLVAEFSKWVTDDLLDELRDLNVDFDMWELELPDVHDLSDYTVDASTPLSPEIKQPIREGVREVINEKGEKEMRKGHYISGYRVVCPFCGCVTIKPLFEDVEEEADS